LECHRSISEESGSQILKRIWQSCEVGFLTQTTQITSSRKEWFFFFFYFLFFLFLFHFHLYFISSSFFFFFFFFVFFIFLFFVPTKGKHYGSLDEVLQYSLNVWPQIVGDEHFRLLDDCALHEKIQCAQLSSEMLAAFRHDMHLRETQLTLAQAGPNAAHTQHTEATIARVTTETNNAVARSLAQFGSRAPRVCEDEFHTAQTAFADRLHDEQAHFAQVCAVCLHDAFRAECSARRSAAEGRLRRRKTALVEQMQAVVKSEEVEAVCNPARNMQHAYDEEVEGFRAGTRAYAQRFEATAAAELGRLKETWEALSKEARQDYEHHKHEKIKQIGGFDIGGAGSIVGTAVGTVLSAVSTAGAAVLTVLAPPAGVPLLVAGEAATFGNGVGLGVSIQSAVDKRKRKKRVKQAMLNSE
jgi:Ca2+/Na+ antiporter